MSNNTIIASIPNVSIGYIPYLTSSGYASSLIYTNGTNVGIGTASPTSIASGYTSLTTNGTNGSGLVMQVNGTATGYLYAESGSLNITNTSGSMIFYNGGAERMRITSTGNVGIGTSDATHRLTMQNGTSEVGIKLTDGTNNTYFAHAAAANNFANGAAAGDAVVRGSNGISLAPNNGSATAMRITSGGVVCLNQTATQGAETLEISPKAYGSIQYSIIINGNPGSYTYTSAMRFHNVGTAVVGSITFGTSTTSYNTTSDYRLKTDFKEFNGLSILDKIKMYDFEWTTDKSRMYGAIAHELNEVLPAAVVGEKDAVDEDGKIIPQGVDYSKIVPVLVNAIQELSAKVTALENK